MLKRSLPHGIASPHGDNPPRVAMSERLRAMKPSRQFLNVLTLFTEPMRGANRKAIGQDLWHNADQRQAMQRALATGAPPITTG